MTHIFKRSAWLSVMRSTPEALLPFNTLIQCIERNICGPSQQCISDNCATNQPVMTPPKREKIETYMDLKGDLKHDPDSDSACKTECLLDAPSDAVELFNDLGACSDTYMCEREVTCLSTNCQEELIACALNT